MGYNTAQTSWPTIAVSDESKALIDRFFSLMDDANDGVGDKLADEIFTSDSTFITAAGIVTGCSGKNQKNEPPSNPPCTHHCDHVEIRKCREHAWNVIKKRRHSVQRVYTHDSQCSDLMLIGNVEMDLIDGRSVAMEFTARIVLATDTTSGLKFRSYQVWAVGCLIECEHQKLADNIRTLLR